MGQVPEICFFLDIFRLAFKAFVQPSQPYTSIALFLCMQEVCVEAVKAVG